MEKPADMRIRRTRKLLVESMFSLLESRGFDDISVRDICDHAMVHRATFYKHYKDKHDFFEYCIETKIEELCPSLTGDSLLFTRKEYFMELISKVLDFLDDNRKMIKITVEATHSNTFIDTIHAAICAEICRKLSENESSGVAYRVPVKMLGEYYAGAWIALAKWWVLSEANVTKQELAGYISILLDESVYSKML